MSSNYYRLLPLFSWVFQVLAIFPLCHCWTQSWWMSLEYFLYVIVERSHDECRSSISSMSLLNAVMMNVTRVFPLCHCWTQSWWMSLEYFLYVIVERSHDSFDLYNTFLTSQRQTQHWFSFLRLVSDRRTILIGKFQNSSCSWAGWIECCLVANPQSHVFAWCGSDKTRNLCTLQNSNNHLSHDTTKYVSGDFRPAKIQTRLLSYRN